MCGDLEEEDDRRQRSSRRCSTRASSRTPARCWRMRRRRSETPADNTRYMEKLFTDALSRAVKDCEQAAPTGATSA